jgi:hypothetical protein
MVEAINNVIRRGPHTLERISVLKVAAQATIGADFILRTTSTTV